MPKPAVLISKSKYIEGLQCPKLLWYEYNRKAEIPPPDQATQALFDQGHIVGAYAQQLFPSGIKLAWEKDPLQYAAKSRAAAEQRRPLFEAGFVFGQAYAIADILLPVADNAWDLIEVKSTASVKDEHAGDVAFQKFVYEGAGLKIRRCFLMYVNTNYIRRGAVDPAQLLLKEDISALVAELQDQVRPELDLMLQVIKEPRSPEVKIGPHCQKPYPCRLQPLCWKFLPEEDHVFLLYAGGKRCFDLMERGILRVSEIPPEIELNERQLIQVRSHQTGKAHVDQAAIQEFLAELKYPLFFLDFETLAPAVPVYDQTRPFENVPFQYVLYEVEKAGAQPKVFSYLAPGADDPRPEILSRLKKQLGDSGSILAYSASYELSCLRNSCAAYPEYQAWFAALPDRFSDLLKPFQKFFYYHPDQGGSASLKSVLPAITGGSYQGLAIGDGGVASMEYLRVTFNPAVSLTEKARVRQALEQYCDLDTRGMMDILAVLQQAAE